MKEYLVKVTVDESQLEIGESLASQLEWSSQNGITFETPVEITDSYTHRVEGTKLSRHLDGDLILKVNNLENYPNVVIAHKDGRLETTLMVLEFMEREQKTRAIVFPDLDPDTEGKVIEICMNKEYPEVKG